MHQDLRQMTAEFSGPGQYQIVVQGSVPAGWASRLGSMRIETAGAPEAEVTKLTGTVADQIELSGILSTLQSLRLPLLSLQRLEDAAPAAE